MENRMRITLVFTALAMATVIGIVTANIHTAKAIEFCHDCFNSKKNHSDNGGSGGSEGSSGGGDTGGDSNSGGGSSDQGSGSDDN